MDSETKVCNRCKNEYPLTDEYWGRNRHGNFSARCKVCDSAYFAEWYAKNKQRVSDRRRAQREADRDEYNAKARAYYAENSERMRAKCRKYHAAHREDRNQKSREYAAANRERLIQKSKEWNAAHPERLREFVRKSQQRHPETGRVALQRRFARKRGLPHDFTVADWRRALNYFHGCCAVCGRPLRDLFGTHKAAQDHWIPLSAPDCPGTVATNIVPLCHGIGGCNNRKNATMPDEWLQQQYGKRKAAAIAKRVAEYFEWVENRQADSAA